MWINTTGQKLTLEIIETETVKSVEEIAQCSAARTTEYRNHQRN